MRDIRTIYTRDGLTFFDKLERLKMYILENFTYKRTPCTISLIERDEQKISLSLLHCNPFLQYPPRRALGSCILMAVEIWQLYATPSDH
jgi:hypothetical protein